MVLSTGVLQPDVIVLVERTAYVIDVGISANSTEFPMSRVYGEKIRKYGAPEVMNAARELTGATEVKILPAILHWRGFWHRKSARSMKQVYPGFILEWMTKRTLDGSGFTWAAFMRAIPPGAL